MTDVVRVVHSLDGYWTVVLSGRRVNDFTFKRRFCAEAFGRAVAQRANKELQVIARDGVSRLKPVQALTYRGSME